VRAGRELIADLKPWETEAMIRLPRMRATHLLPRLTLTLALVAAFGFGGAARAAPAADAATLAELQRQLAQVQAALQQLSDENRALREHEKQIDQQLAQLSAQAAAAGSAPALAAVPAAGANAAPPPPANASALPAAGTPVSTSLGPVGSGLRLWGYGELYYTHPVHDTSQTQADLARAVFGIGYKFDDRTEFNSEYEIEHAVASADDVGEFEVEQFYVDRRLNDAVTARAGLFLMPFGLLNENHEPTNFYGVQRNFVETLIIPSTWREGGVNLHGDTAAGFGWNVGLTTGMNLSEWDFAPEFPPYRNALELENNGIAPLQASHQELSLADAHHLSQYLALSYFGVPGLKLGAAISTGKAAAAVGDPRVTLWEAHARWTPARWELSALYARGTISGLTEVNAMNPGSPNPIPSAFDGYFLQGAYQLWEHGDYRFNPFVRFERYNLGASFEGTVGPAIPAGLVPMSPSPGDFGYWPVNHDRVWTGGANFYIGQHLVLKADYQWFQENTNFTRFDLGLGVAF
jgi:cell division protein FtsB